jgi:hypothetical protein
MQKFTEERIAKVDELYFDKNQREFLDLFVKLTVNTTEVKITPEIEYFYTYIIVTFFFSFKPFQESYPCAFQHIIEPLNQGYQTGISWSIHSQKTWALWSPMVLKMIKIPQYLAFITF